MNNSENEANTKSYQDYMPEDHGTTQPSQGMVYGINDTRIDETVDEGMNDDKFGFDTINEEENDDFSIKKAPQVSASHLSEGSSTSRTENYKLEKHVKLNVVSSQANHSLSLGLLPSSSYDPSIQMKMPLHNEMPQMMCFENQSKRKRLADRFSQMTYFVFAFHCFHHSRITIIKKSQISCLQQPNYCCVSAAELLFDHRIVLA